MYNLPDDFSMKNNPYEQDEQTVCDICGEESDKLDFMEAGSDLLICPTCRKTKVICWSCGEVFDKTEDKLHKVDGEWMCHECFQSI